jgi:hypothetical protein
LWEMRDEPCPSRRSQCLDSSLAVYSGLWFNSCLR